MNLAKIGDVVTKAKTWDPRKDAPDDLIRYIDIGSVSQDTKVIEGLTPVMGSEAPSRARQLVQTGDILVSTVRPNLNAVTRVPEELDGATASTGFCILRPKPDHVYPAYLFHWVRTGEFVAEMMRQATGQSYPAVSDKIVKASEISLPPLEEQKRIAGILDQAAELCCLRTRALDKLNTLGQAIFHEMFGSVHSNPHGFERVFLGDLIKVSSGQGLTAKDMIPGNFPVYGGNGINGYHNEGPVGANRIVIGRVGVYCGAVHVTRQPCWVTDNALLVRQLQPCSVTYLAEALRVANLNQYAGRAAQPLISGSRIYPVEILLPPEDQQKSFEEALQAISRQQYAAERASSKIGDLFASLQHRAFREEL
ncbi:restriction endonuclease subunit S [Gluconobacter oxydans]|uniref:restriction endonuclease subunit S n=1 Tax=Gluconobacter oxydans TaxID=442 RepID=UPI000421429B|nr:restriction endonuclease subunit S [Gluconobacter oxydans]